ANTDVFPGLTINSLPIVQSSLPAGTYTEAFLAGGISSLQSVSGQISSNPSLASLLLLSAINTQKSATDNLVTQIDKVVKDPSQSVTITNNSGPSIVLNSSTLAATDRAILAFVSQLTNQVPASSSPIVPAALTAAEISTAATSSCQQPDPNLTMLCQNT